MLRSHLPTKIALTAALVASAVALGGVPGRAATLQIPPHAKLTIKGHGWGHGHGLSEYGARGAAEQGLSAKKILHFYYPRTKPGHLHRQIGVLITEDTDLKTVVRNRSGLRVKSVPVGPTVTLPSKGKIGKATKWRLSAGLNGATKVSYHTKGWHAWRTIPGDVEFKAKGKKPLTLLLPSGPVTYRGALQSRIPPPGTTTLKRVTINKLALDGYVQGVVPREMPALWPAAALQAQAVAARTYAAFEARHSSNKMWGVCDTSACQVYGGKSAETKMSNAAVAKTKNKVLLFHGAPAFTQFGSSDGGWTAKFPGKPFLPAKKDPYEKHSNNPYHTWTDHLRAKKIEKAWPSLGSLRSISVDERDGNGQWGGRVLRLTLHGSAGDVKFGSADNPTRTIGIFTSTLGLRSTWFDITV